ncbi:PREDICTED: insecticyanin-B-like [Papilio xuthus]|uniref:Bilin binding protein 3 n=1 Tax=Papilio xuthus TaxID=66420 RepID=I4DII3_PAPXU|nr:insecticyanin-B-like precursor [Papilio xuthus]KPI92171.1 Insecticyanin-B [Papilio xuthus]BAM17723.1 bilin binding protein 3 [Papilio xuthus]
MFRFLVIAFLAVAAADVVIVDGPCPDVKPMESFKFSDYQGTWYEVAKFPNTGEDGKKGKCTTAEYTIDGDKGKVKNSQVVDGVKSYVDGDIALIAPGKVRITYKFEEFTKNSVLTVLDTDYKNYAIGYSCKFLDKENKHQVFSWILSRTKSLGDSQAKVDAFLANFPAIDKSNYVFNDFSEETCKFTSTKAITSIRKKN